MHTQGCRVAGNVDPQVAMQGTKHYIATTLGWRRTMFSNTKQVFLLNPRLIGVEKV